MRASLEKQRLSIQKQAAASRPVNPPGESSGGSAFFSMDLPALQGSGPGVIPCDAMPKAEIQKLVQAASEEQGLQAGLIEAVIGRESAAHPCALSPKGAQGLMQLMPATAMEMGVADPFDPKQNIEGGARLLKLLLTRYNGDVALALGAYNAGPGRVDREGGIPQIPETVSYVSDILNRFHIQ